MDKSKRKRIITLALLILVPILVYTIIISEKGVDNFFYTLSRLKLEWVACSIAFMFIYWLIDAFILYITCKFAKSPLPFLKTVGNTFVGQFFNSVTPFATGGQPMQIYHLVSGCKMSPGVASMVTLLKFIIYQTTLTVYSLVVIIFKWDFFSKQLSKILLLAILGFLLNSAIIIMCNIFAHNKAAADKIITGFLKLMKLIRLIKDIKSKHDEIEAEVVQFYNGYKLLRSNMKMWITCITLTTLQLTAIYAIPFFINLGFGSSGDFINMVGAQAFVQMVVSFIPLPGASGAAEGSFYVFFQMFFKKETLAAAVLIWRIITYYSCILVGAVYFIIPVIANKLRLKQND